MISLRSCLAVALFLCIGAYASAEPWKAKEDAFRLSITADAGAYRRADDLILTPLASSNLTRNASANRYLDVTSLKLFELKKDGKPAMDTWNVFSGGAGGVIGKWEPTRSAGRTKPNAVWGEMVVSVGWGKGEALFDNIFLREMPSGDAVKITLGAPQKKPWFVW